MKRSLILVWLATMGACDPAPQLDAALPDVPGADVPLDAPLSDGGFSGCRADEDCDDGAFCNGEERCRPDDAEADPLGCVAGPLACLAGQTCFEVGDRCVTECAVEEDADHDGVNAAECGGTDCDDADPRRRPGLPEVCDADGHDEDCNDATVGNRDADGDGAIDAACCNAETCGEDCNDGRADVRPGGTEVCDGLDQNCDGTVDEGTLAPGYPDLDGDLHGDRDASASMACTGTAHRVPIGDDCDDADPTVHPAQVEIRDGLDNDCDGDTDEDVQTVTFFRDLDGDGFGNAGGGTQRSDAPIEGYSVLASDCDDGVATIRPSANEACNAVDDDCDGLRNFVIEPGDLEDDDRDDFADAACGGEDCNDLDFATGPEALEVCDSRDNDCDGTVDDGSVEIAWHLDRDGDGVGDERSPPVYSCELVEGRVPAFGDCDDEDASRSPLALDGCAVPSIDDDCDGRIDEAGALRPFYRDADGDGVGAGAVILSCGGAVGVSDRDEDCDDGAAARSPDATEACTGGIDEDCDGAVDCADPSCSGSPGCSIVYALALVSGGSQSARIASPLGSPVRVRLTEGGAPRAGRLVTVTVPDGGHATSLTETTDAAGEVVFSLWVGRAVGTYDFVLSTLGAAPLTVSATATAPTAVTVHTLVNRAGTAGTLAAGDGAAAAARPRSIAAIEVASDGALYLADPDAHAVYTVSPRGTLRRIAGTGASGSTGDGGLATAASLIEPVSLALDETTGRLFVADAGAHRIRVIALALGTIDTYAGTGASDDAVAEGVPARLVPMPAPRAIGLSGGDLVVAHDGGRVRRIDGATGLVTELSRFVSSAPLCERGCDVVAAPGGEPLISGRLSDYCAGTSEPYYAVSRTGPEGDFVLGTCGTLTGDGVPARSFANGRAGAMALEPSGDLVVAVEGRIVRVAARTTRTTALVGRVGSAGSGAEDLSPSLAIGEATALAAHGTTLYFADGPRVRAVEGLLRSSTENVTLSPVGTPITGDVMRELAVSAAIDDGMPITNTAIWFEAITPGLVVSSHGALTDGTGTTSTYTVAGRQVGTQQVRVRYLDVHGRDTPGSPIVVPITVPSPPSGAMRTLFNRYRTTDFDGDDVFDWPLHGVPGPAGEAYGGPMRGLAAASDGTVYTTVSHYVIAISPEGLASIVAGGGDESDPGMDIPARSWRFASLDSLALDEGSQLLYAMTRDHQHADPPGIFEIDLTTGRVRHLYESSGPRPPRPRAPYPAIPTGSGHLSFAGGVLRSGWLTVDRTTGAMTAQVLPAGNGLVCDSGTTSRATAISGDGYGGLGVLPGGARMLVASGARNEGGCACFEPGLYLTEATGTGVVPRAGNCFYDDTFAFGAFSVGAPSADPAVGCDAQRFAWAPITGRRVLALPETREPSCRAFVEIDLDSGVATAREAPYGPEDHCIEPRFGCAGPTDDPQILSVGPGGTYAISYVQTSSMGGNGLSGAVVQLY